jgi:hypothetical protein
VLRPHTARYVFTDIQGGDAGQEEVVVERRPGGWRVTSRLDLSLPVVLACDIEWHLEQDLSTHVLYMAATDAWGDDYTLELAVTGNGLLGSRGGPDGPTQVEMGWGRDVELDHVSAAFTTILLARWNMAAHPRRDVTSVYIRAEDLVPEPLEQRYVVVSRDPAAATTRVQRIAPGTGSSTLVTVLDGGIVAAYEGLFRVAEGWRFSDDRA